MKRKIFGWALLTAAVVGVLMLIPVCRLTVVGLLRGERFHDGRPMGYWLDLLQNGQPGEQKQAADALVAIGPDAAPALVDVFEYTGSTYAARALGKMGPAAGPAAIGALVNAVRDDDAYEAGDALAAMGDTGAGGLLPLLDDPDPKVRGRAAYRLGKCGPSAGKAVPRLIEMLRTEDREDNGESVPQTVRTTLVEIGAPAVPALTELLHSGDVVLRAWAVIALGQIGLEARSAEADVLALLDEGYDFVRVYAAEALWSIDPKQVDRVLPVLRAGLGKRGGFFQTTSEAADALSRIGKPAVPLLVDVLKTGATDARCDAAQALGKIGQDAADAVPALTEALRDRSLAIGPVLDSLGGVGPAAAGATDELIAVYKEGDSWKMDHIITVFEKIGPGAKAAAPLLIEALKDKKDEVRRDAARALGAMGPEAKDAAPALTDALADHSTRAAAAEALWRIDGRKEPLLDLLRDEKEQDGAIQILERIGPKVEWVVPALTEALRREVEAKKLYGDRIVRILADWGPEARSAVPVLVAAIHQEGRYTSEGDQLATNLAKIDPEAAAALDRPNYGLYAAVGGGLVGAAVAWVWWRKRTKKSAARASAAPAAVGPNPATEMGARARPPPTGRRRPASHEESQVYPSGVWRGYWEQAAFGRQPMTDFVLRFAGGAVEGEGCDLVGRFTFTGTCDDQGNVVMVKQYLGRHRVLYRGRYDGEGTIHGTWSIGERWSGPFALSPVRSAPNPDVPIQDIS